MLKLKCHKIRIKKTLKKMVLIAFDSRANKKVDQYHHSMFTITIDKFFRKMKLDRESFDFKYVSDEIISNLILAQDYPTVLPYKGYFPALKQILSGIASVSKSLNSDLAQHFVGGPD